MGHVPGSIVPASSIKYNVANSAPRVFVFLALRELRCLIFYRAGTLQLNRIRNALWDRVSDKSDSFIYKNGIVIYERCVWMGSL